MSLYQDYSLEQLKEKVTRSPDEVDLQIELIKRFVQAENFEAAIHQAEQAEKLAQHEPMIPALRAFCLIRVGHANVGSELLDSLARQNATCEFQDLIHNDIAPLFYEDMGEMDMDEFIQDKIDNAPEEQKRVFQRAQAFMPIQSALIEGQLELAVGLLKEHLVDFPGDLNAEMGLAGVYEMLGRNEESIELYRKVIEKDPQSASAYFGLAMVVADLDEAVELSRQGIELTPHAHGERFNLGVRLAQTGQHDQALEHWKRIPADDQIYPYAMCGISEHYEIKNELSLAIEYQEKAAMLAAADPEMHARLGALRIDDGEFESGLQSLETAIQLDPSSTPILLLRADAIDQMGQTETAISLLEKVVATAPDDYYLNQGLGIFYYRLEDFETSIEFSLRAIQANCESYASYWNAAVSYARLDQRDECLEYLRAAVDRNPDAANRIMQDDDLQIYCGDREFQELAQVAG